MLPYLFISFCIIILSRIKFCITGSPCHAAPFFDSFSAIGIALLYGEVQGQFWYVPLILVIFLFTPLIIRLNNKMLYYTALTTFFIPIIFPRTYTNAFRFIFYFSYFAPGFLFDVFVAANISKAIDLIEKHLFVLISIFLISSISFMYIVSSGLYLGHHEPQVILYISRFSMCTLLFYYLVNP